MTIPCSNISKKLRTPKSSTMLMLPIKPTPIILSISTNHPITNSTSIMGIVIGKMGVETPKYDLLKSTDEYEIRNYPPSVVAEVTYNPTEFKSERVGGFGILASYIGVMGNPQNAKNAKPEKIAMTTPVITQSPPEKIAMTTPVVTKAAGEESKKGLTTMHFTLPAKYVKAEEVPRPLDKRVVIREERERKYGVVKFGWVATEEVVEKKVHELRVCLERDGYKVNGEMLLARYNPPWFTLPPFRTNEVMLPIE